MTDERALFTIDGDTPDAIFEGWHDSSVRWNGWACPSFERSEVERIKAWAEHLERQDGAGASLRLTFDGDTVVIDNPSLMGDTDYAPEYVERGTDGRYAVGAWSWCWSEVAEPAITPCDVCGEDFESDPQDIHTTVCGECQSAATPTEGSTP